jgi:Zn-dependent alcohol dehydrogenase
MAIISAWLLGAQRVIAIDQVPERLAMARTNGRAETIDLHNEDIVGVAGVAGEIPLCTLGLFLIASRHRRARTFIRELPRHHQTEPARSAGDHH